MKRPVLGVEKDDVRIGDQGNVEPARSFGHFPLGSHALPGADEEEAGGLSVEARKGKDLLQGGWVVGEENETIRAAAKRFHEVLPGFFFRAALVFKGFRELIRGRSQLAASDDSAKVLITGWVLSQEHGTALAGGGGLELDARDGPQPFFPGKAVKDHLPVKVFHVGEGESRKAKGSSSLHEPWNGGRSKAKGVVALRVERDEHGSNSFRQAWRPQDEPVVVLQHLPQEMERLSANHGRIAVALADRVEAFEELELPALGFKALTFI